MNTTLKIVSALASVAGLAVLGAFAVRPSANASPTAVERGRYLVQAMGCNDCHTPMVLGPQGPHSDDSRYLSGHPHDMTLPPVPALPAGPWTTVVAGSMTAWAGPWGISYSANLTPDDETGLGRWTADDFVATMRSGRHLGRGRAILPPMPVTSLDALTDEDLRAVFAYLHSVPPIHNAVPAPVPPTR